MRVNYEYGSKYAITAHTTAPRRAPLIQLAKRHAGEGGHCRKSSPATIHINPNAAPAAR
jgi:hypothetical protein